MPLCYVHSLANQNLVLNPLTTMCANHTVNPGKALPQLQILTFPIACCVNEMDVHSIIS